MVALRSSASILMKYWCSPVAQIFRIKHQLTQKCKQSGSDLKSRTSGIVLFPIEILRPVLPGTQVVLISGGLRVPKNSGEIKEQRH